MSEARIGIRLQSLCAALVLGALAGCGGRVQETPPNVNISESLEEDFDQARLTGTLVFVSDRSGMQKIWSLRAGDKNACRLTRDGNSDSWPRFSPSGGQILYTTLRDTGPEIWRMSRDGSSPIFVTKGERASWSPDGASIAFFRNNHLYLRELAAATERRTAANDWPSSVPPAWSPDGRSLVLSTRQADGNNRAFLVNLRDNQITPLKSDEPCSVLQWSRDGKTLLCQDDEGHIARTDPDGKNWLQLTAGADLQQHARYAPDGARIVFCRASDPDGPWQICLKDIASADLDFVRLTRHGSNLQPDWSAAD
jgi:TolB protein